LFQRHKKFINLDDYVDKLGRMSNVNLMSLFDCCREKQAKKCTNNAEINIDLTENQEIEHGTSSTFYAK
jgi:hypothetical protein